MSYKAVFLDRDGTIAKDVPYCSSPDDFNLLPTVPEAIKIFNESNFKVVVITNQSGISRGYFTEKTLAKIHKKMGNELKKQGAKVDAIYYCPHHPDDNCDCRKPKTALFQQAAKELNINIGNSYVVGDMPLDINAGKSLGCRTVIVTTGPDKGSCITNTADYTAHNLLEAAQWIVENAR